MFPLHPVSPSPFIRTKADNVSAVTKAVTCISDIQDQSARAEADALRTYAEITPRRNTLPGWTAGTSGVAHLVTAGADHIVFH
jgi:hypothetical protein